MTAQRGTTGTQIKRRGIYGSTNNGVSNVAMAFACWMDGNFVCVNGVKSAAGFSLLPAADSLMHVGDVIR